MGEGKGPEEEGTWLENFDDNGSHIEQSSNVSQHVAVRLKEGKRLHNWVRRLPFAGRENAEPPHWQYVRHIGRVLTCEVTKDHQGNSTV